MTFEEAFDILCDELGDEFNWGFIPLTSKHFRKQLDKEINEGHHLYGKVLHSTARCSSNDDVLFVTINNDGNDLYIIVHLTYSDYSSPNYPSFIILGNTLEMMDYLRKRFAQDML